MTTRTQSVRAYTRKSPDRPDYLNNTAHLELRTAYWPDERLGELCEQALEEELRGFAAHMDERRV